MVFDGDSTLHEVACRSECVERDQDKLRGIAFHIGYAILFCRLCNCAMRYDKLYNHLRKADHQALAASILKFSETSQVRLT